MSIIYIYNCTSQLTGKSLDVNWEVNIKLNNKYAHNKTSLLWITAAVLLTCGGCCTGPRQDSRLHLLQLSSISYKQNNIIATATEKYLPRGEMANSFGQE